MPPLNPGCTDFCTGGRDDVKGHRATSPADIEFMLRLLADAGIEAGPSQAAVHALYRKGYGYHAVADALGISHEDGFRLLTGASPGFTWNGAGNG